MKIIFSPVKIREKSLEYYFFLYVTNIYPYGKKIILKGKYMAVADNFF
jgi:hypothetical protein